VEHEKANSSHVIGSENSLRLLAISLFKRSFALEIAKKISSIYIFFKYKSRILFAFSLHEVIAK
jgi:hypothetical protein